MITWKVPTHRWVTYGAILVVLAGTGVTMLVRSSVTPNLLDFALPVVAAVALLWRRSHPVLVLLVVMTATGAYYPLAHVDGTIIVAAVLALYNAADQGHLTAAIVVAGVALFGMVYGESRGTRHLDNYVFAIVIEGIVATVAAGGVTRNRRAYLHEVEQRALDAERGKEEEAHRRATEERLRIARELHDVLGHNISLINVQAGAALHGIRKRPEDAEAALKAIKEASKETLRELRTTLGVLRQVDEDAPTAPAPSLERLDELVRHPELVVKTEISPTSEIPVEVDLAAARIVQEALTNVSRHSAARSATLNIHQQSGNIVITVTDDGPGATFTDGTGYGVQGMRERAVALGGTLEAGPRPEGGYRVVAVLPLNGAR